MKTFRFFATCAVLATAYAMASASETSDNFAQWVPNFAASDLNQRRDAQQNWQNFCRQKGNNPDVQKEIIKVSVEQLAKENPVDTTVWIVRQLGIVGDATAVPALTKLLTNNEVRIRDEAARALANIPGKEAEDALKGVNVIVAAQLAKDALTSRNIKANIPPNGSAQPEMLYMPGTDREQAKVFMEGYGKFDDIAKAQFLSNLTAQLAHGRVVVQQLRLRHSGAGGILEEILPNERQNPYLPLALEAVKSNDETLRNAGILAVGALGGEAEVPFLLEQARTGANKDLAKLALSRMSGQRIDALLMENLKSEQDAEKFGILADVLNRRFNSEIRPLLLERAKAADTPNRLQLLQTAEAMSSKDDIPEFVKVWTLITDRGQKDQAEQIIARLSGRTPQSAGDAGIVMQSLGDNWDTPEGLSLLGRIGDAGTLDKIRQSKNAIYAFRNWTNAVVADDLIAIARDDNYSADDRIAALRAFIRVISLRNEEIGIRINDVQKVERLAEAYELATRVDEKRYVIERVGQIRTVESLRFVLKYIDDSELRERVCASVLDLAHQTGLRRSARQEFNAALDKVLEVTANNDFRNRVNQYKAAQ